MWEGTSLVRKRFDAFCIELAAEEARVANVNSHANQLVEDNHFERVNIKSKQRELNMKWAELQQAIDRHKKKLAEVYEVQVFSLELSELMERIEEKETAVGSNDLGHDLRSVEALQRRHEALVRDFSGIEEAVANAGKEGRRILRSQRTLSSSSSLSDSVGGNETGDAAGAAIPVVNLSEEQAKLEAAWNRLRTLAQSRRAALVDAHDSQELASRHRDLATWMADMRNQIQSADAGRDVSSAELAVKQHMEHKSEIDARDSIFGQVRQFGRRILGKSQHGKEDIQQRLDQLDKDKEELMTLWREQKDSIRRPAHLSNVYAGRRSHCLVDEQPRNRAQVERFGEYTGLCPGVTKETRRVQETVCSAGGEARIVAELHEQAGAEWPQQAERHGNPVSEAGQ